MQQINQLTFEMIGAYWLNRTCNLKSMVNQTIGFCEEINKLSPEHFGSWFLTGNSLKEALTNQVTFDYEHIKNIIDPKAKDLDFPDICYDFNVWNGMTHSELSLGISQGSTHPDIPNVCVMTFSKEIQESFFNRTENRQRIKDLFFNFWNPNYVMIDETKFTV